MKLFFSQQPLGVTIKGIFEEDTPSELSKERADQQFRGKEKEFLFKNNTLYTGLGKKEEFDDEKARKAASNAAQHLRTHNWKQFSLIPFQDRIRACTEGVMLGLYQFLEYKTEKLDDIKKVDAVTIVGKKEQKKAFDHAKTVCDAVNLVRDIQNTPSNVATPAYLADKAKTLAKQHHMKITIWDEKELTKRGMNGVMAVAKGSRNTPRFIILEHQPKKAKKKICLVGKGVTFDSGGISLKPGESMDEMKFDMSGAATVMGSVAVLAQLNSPHHVIGIMPCVENMPDGNAYKPGDIIKMMNGKTAEVLNTDAEGRMILADALHYATTLKPDYLIDFATLTGACVVALGNYYAGIMGTNQALIDQLIHAGSTSGDKVWPLPLTPEYREDLDSEIADVKHLGSRAGGTITAAMFLKEFVGKSRWAHIDIAGTAWVTKAKPYKPFGGTGFGVRLMVDWTETVS